MKLVNVFESYRTESFNQLKYLKPESSLPKNSSGLLEVSTLLGYQTLEEAQSAATSLFSQDPEAFFSMLLRIGSDVSLYGVAANKFTERRLEYLQEEFPKEIIWIAIYLLTINPLWTTYNRDY